MLCLWATDCFCEVNNCIALVCFAFVVRLLSDAPFMRVAILDCSLPKCHDVDSLLLLLRQHTLAVCWIGSAAPDRLAH
jgi:spore coat polysaccharide biosynthesis protein SpsF (cytidylyltransferase family)